MKKQGKVLNTILSVFLGILSLAWVYPVFMVIMNSLKKETAISTGTAFKLPTADGFAAHLPADGEGNLPALQLVYYREGVVTQSNIEVNNG